MEVILKSNNQRIKKKIEQDHYWYDSHSKQMYHGRGGKLLLEYSPRYKRSFPKIVDCEDWVYDNNYSIIEEWIENESDLGITVVKKAPGHNIVIDIPAYRFEELMEKLYDAKILSDFDIRELKQELGDLFGTDRRKLRKTLQRLGYD